MARILSFLVLWLPGAVMLSCLLSLPVGAQPTSQPAWQGARPQPQPESSSAHQPLPTPPSSQDLMLGPPQDSSAAHPQVIEVPQPQPAPPAAQQSELGGEQELGGLGKQPEGIPAAQGELLVRRPAYLGITYDTSPSCRYPAGVRVTGMFEDSPAQRAGLRADGKVQWQHAVAGLLALSPAAPLAIPLIMSTDKDSGPGDIVLAVDGERVRRREEFEQTMRRFEPGDMVYFSVLRRGSILQVPVKLEEYPATSEPSVSLAEATTTKGKKVYMY